MNNPRITKKEKGLLKGAMNRVFSRSDLRRIVINNSIILGYSDVNRKRVKTWCKCSVCHNPSPKSYMQVDHIKPKIALHESFDALTLDEYVNRLWCEENNLQAICIDCHDTKSKFENKERRRLKKENKK